MQSCLTDRHQRCKFNNSYSPWSCIKHGVPQGSILEPILFNIFLCDMLFSVDSINIASYAADSTTYPIGKDKCEVENKLEIVSVKLFKLFHENGMKANQRKYHFLSVLT